MIILFSGSSQLPENFSGCYIYQGDDKFYFSVSVSPFLYPLVPSIHSDCVFPKRPLLVETMIEIEIEIPYTSRGSAPENRGRVSVGLWELKPQI